MSTGAQLKAKRLGNAANLVDATEYPYQLKHSRICLENPDATAISGENHDVNVIWTRDEFLAVCADVAALTDPTVEQIAGVFLNAAKEKAGL